MQLPKKQNKKRIPKDCLINLCVFLHLTVYKTVMAAVLRTQRGFGFQNKNYICALQDVTLPYRPGVFHFRT